MRSAYAPPPLQAVTRDFAFLVPEELAADQLLRAVRGADKAAIAGARLFDVFTGPGRARGAEVARDRGDAAAGREELHRRGAQGDLRPDRRRGGEARCPAARPDGARAERRAEGVRGPGRLLRAARLALHRALCFILGESLDRGTRSGAPARLAGRSRCDGRWRSPLRLCGGLHALVRRGDAPELARLYPPAPTPSDARAAVGARPSRSSSMPRCSALARQRAADQRGRPLGGADERACSCSPTDFGLPMRLFELGASAGLNLQLDRYHHDLGGRLRPERRIRRCSWRRIGQGRRRRTAPVPHRRARRASTSIRSIRLPPGSGCSLMSGPTSERRLRQLEVALDMAAVDPPARRSRRCRRLARGAAAASSRSRAYAASVMHSVAFQYFPAEAQAAGEGARSRQAGVGGQRGGARWPGCGSRSWPPTTQLSLRLRTWPGEDICWPGSHPHGRLGCDWLLSC